MIRNAGASFVSRRLSVCVVNIFKLQFSGNAGNVKSCVAITSLSYVMHIQIKSCYWESYLALYPSYIGKATYFAHATPVVRIYNMFRICNLCISHMQMISHMQHLYFAYATHVLRICNIFPICNIFLQEVFFSKSA